MSKREEVIKALKCCKYGSCPVCPYYDEALGGGCGMYDDALELLEPVKPISDQGAVVKTYVCGNCGMLLNRGKHKYCAICGRAVKWE